MGLEPAPATEATAASAAAPTATEAAASSAAETTTSATSEATAAATTKAAPATSSSEPSPAAAPAASAAAAACARGPLWLWEEPLQGQELRGVDEKLVSLGVGCCYHAVCHLNGEVHGVDGAKHLLHFPHLGLVFQVNGGVEVGNLGV